MQGSTLNSVWKLVGSLVGSTARRGLVLAEIPALQTRLQAGHRAQLGIFPSQFCPLARHWDVVSPPMVQCPGSARFGVLPGSPHES